MAYGECPFRPAHNHKPQENWTTMTFDVTKHTLVPKHTKLGDKDKESLLKNYNVTIRELPKMLASDPAISKLSVKIGDIIKIERGSRTAGLTIYYRAVVEG